MFGKKSSWRGAALLTGAAALLLTSATGGLSASAEETGNNLSVPTLFIGGLVGTPTCTTGDDYQPPSGGMGVDTDADGIADEHTDFYVQGVATWQADCESVTAGELVTPKWGDNLTGAPLKVGTPVRIELGLLGTAPTSLTTNTFNVVKLDPDALDRESHYGTTGDFLATPEVRVWAPATYTIVGSNGTIVVPEQTMGAEINSTGRVVYGEQYTFTAGGTYTVTVEVPSVNFGTADAPDHDTAIELVISSTSGGGGKKQGGGGRPDNPGGGGGAKGPKAPK